VDKEYTLYCDESEKYGRFYSNFYAGVMVDSSQHDRIVSILEAVKKELHLQGEIKWSKVTERYLEKYQEIIKAFFTEIKAGHLRVRIMFRQNVYQPQGLTEEDHKNSYFKLYYQFIKNAYGLPFARLDSSTKLRVYFDVFPENREAASQFKGFLLGLNKDRRIRKAGLSLRQEDIAEVNSHDHVLLQCLDVVLGAIQFRLNEKQNEKIYGSEIRAKRTIAKEKLYYTVLGEIKSIKEIFKDFDIGISTFTPNNAFGERWSEPYLHWSFVPKIHIFRSEFAKVEKNNPNPPTQPLTHNVSLQQDQGLPTS
jgi:hypothetical protein